VRQEKITFFSCLAQTIRERIVQSFDKVTNKLETFVRSRI